MTNFTYDTFSAAGTDLGHSRLIELDQHRIEAFAEITEDRQWIQIDPDRAAHGPFGSTIAHGYSLGPSSPASSTTFSTSTASVCR